MMQAQGLGPEDIIIRLAGQFPALKKAPGLDPWKPEDLDHWGANGATGSGARAAVKFILAVWNGDEVAWEVGGFRLSDVRHFDDENLEAWKTWAARPFFL